jgi:hypothetical protein
MSNYELRFSPPPPGRASLRVATTELLEFRFEGKEVFLFWILYPASLSRTSFAFLPDGHSKFQIRIQILSRIIRHSKSLDNGLLKTWGGRREANLV